MLEIGKLGDDVSGVLFDQLRVAFSFSWNGRSFIAKVPRIIYSSSFSNRVHDAVLNFTSLE